MIRRRALAGFVLAVIAAGAAPAVADPGLPPPALDPAVLREALPELKFNVYLPRDLMRRRAPAPVIAWGNGGCVTFDRPATPLFETWAKAGFVVLGVNDPDGPQTMAQVMARAQAAAGPGAPPPPRVPTGAALAAAVEAQTAAQVRMFDWAERASAKGGRFAGKLDTKRMVFAGNSCGGVTAVNASWRDRRAKALFILTGSANVSSAPEDKRKADAVRIALPALYVVGGDEDLARAPVRVEWDALRPGLPAVLVERSSGDHVTLSSDPGMLRDAGAIGINWFRAMLYGDRAAARELTTRACAQCDPAIWSVRSKNIAAAR